MVQLCGVFKSGKVYLIQRPNVCLNDKTVIVFADAILCTQAHRIITMHVKSSVKVQ